MKLEMKESIPTTPGLLGLVSPSARSGAKYLYSPRGMVRAPYSLPTCSTVLALSATCHAHDMMTTQRQESAVLSHDISSV